MVLNKSRIRAFLQITCPQTFVTIPGTSTPGGRHCGSIFNSADQQTLPSTVVGTTTGPGFTVGTFFGTTLGVAATTDALSGYSLDYNQVDWIRL